MKSPCIKICQIDPATKHCSGCFRTIKEIATWSRLTEQERDDIMEEIDNRRLTLIFSMWMPIQ
jgi:predicted Fe-S protein YdhL (DUF1289 family)